MKDFYQTFQPANIAYNRKITMTEAFIPARYREGDTYEIIGKDYQRIANELKERGNEIEWTSAGPISVFRDEKGNRTGEMDVSFMFMYPTIIMPMPEVPNA